MRVVLKWGALVGAVTYIVVGLVLTALALAAFGSTQASVDSNPGKLALGCVSIFLLLFSFSAAGFYTGRETLRPGLGALAGMVSFVVYAVLSSVYVPGGTTLSLGSGSSGGTGASQIVSAIVAGALVLGIAALMGWLGGRPGAQRGRRAKARASAETTPTRV